MFYKEFAMFEKIAPVLFVAGDTVLAALCGSLFAAIAFFILH